jgi:septum formation protein
MKLVLASASPRRAEILSAARIPFDVVPTGIDEARYPGEGVEAMVERLAQAKARAAFSRIAAADPAIVIGADTVVELDGDFLGKPGSAQAAREMLGRLSGRSHRVFTGLALVRVPGGASRVAVETTRVWFVPLRAAEIEEYVATCEPLDKAGGYAIQGFGGRFVERIEGCYFNVVGLPLARLYRLLGDFGWP